MSFLPKPGGKVRSVVDLVHVRSVVDLVHLLVQTISNFPFPMTLTDRRSLMKLINRFADSMPDLEQAMAPWQSSLKKSNVFVWGECHKKALAKVKEIITNPKGPCDVEVDRIRLWDQMDRRKESRNRRCAFEEPGFAAEGHDDIIIRKVADMGPNPALTKLAEQAEAVEDYQKVGAALREETQIKNLHKTHPAQKYRSQ